MDQSDNQTEKLEEVSETIETEVSKEASEEVTEEASTEKTAVKAEEPTATTTEAPEEGAPVRVVPAADEYVLPEGVPIQLAQFANANDMTQDQLDAVLNQFASFTKGSQEHLAREMRKAGESHVKAWGDKSEYNLSLVRRALRQNDPSGSLRELLDSTGYGNHPVVLDFFLSLGNSMKEGGYIKGAVNRPTPNRSTAETLFGKTHPSKN